VNTNLTNAPAPAKAAYDAAVTAEDVVDAVEALREHAVDGAVYTEEGSPAEEGGEGTLTVDGWSVVVDNDGRGWGVTVQPGA
jgi:hypothetical protein